MQQCKERQQGNKARQGKATKCNIYWIGWKTKKQEYKKNKKQKTKNKNNQSKIKTILNGVFNIFRKDK
jgi:hypothetical protein